MVKWTDR